MVVNKVISTTCSRCKNASLSQISLKIIDWGMWIRVTDKNSSCLHSCSWFICGFKCFEVMFVCNSGRACRQIDRFASKRPWKRMFKHILLNWWRSSAMLVSEEQIYTDEMWQWQQWEISRLTEVKQHWFPESVSIWGF